MKRFIIAAALLLSAMSSRAAATVFVSIDIAGPPSGYRQDFTVKFTGGLLQDAQLAIVQDLTKFWYDPLTELIEGNNYVVAYGCSPGPSCGGVSGFIAAADSVRFTFTSPTSFNRCVLGRNPYVDCAEFWDDPLITLDADLTSNGAVLYTVTPGALTAVPETGLWALMITGFGLSGVALRRRRWNVQAATLRYANDPVGRNLST